MILSLRSPFERRLRSKKTPSAVDRVPSEILSAIFRMSMNEDWCSSPSRDTVSTLRTYCLVCAAWAAEAMPLLYKFMSVSTRFHNASSNMVSSLRKHGDLVRALEIQDSGLPRPGPTATFTSGEDRFNERKQLLLNTITTTLSICPLLQEVRLNCGTVLQDFDFDLILRALRFQERLDTVLYRAVMPAELKLTTTQLSGMFSSVPRLKKITISGLVMSLELPDYPKMGCLRSLSLHDVEFSGVEFDALMKAIPYLESLYLATCTRRFYFNGTTNAIPTEEDIAKALMHKAGSMRHIQLNISDVERSPGFPLQDGFASLVRLETFVCLSRPSAPSFFRGDVFDLFPHTLYKFRINTTVGDLSLNELTRILPGLRSSVLGKWSLRFSAASAEWDAWREPVLSAAQKRGLCIAALSKRLGDSQVMLDILEQ